MLDDPLVLLRQRFVVEADAARERFLELAILHMLEVRLEICAIDVQEARLFLVGQAVRQNVVGCKTTLLARRHEANDRSVLRVFADRKVGWLGHLDHERREVRYVEALDVYFHREGSSTGRKVEDGLSSRAHPFAQIASIGERDAESDDAGLVLGLRCDVTGA